MKVIEPLTTELRSQNFRNMVWFYQNELRLILNGKKASDVFSLKQRRSLRYLNILYTYPTKFKRKKIWDGRNNMVTPEAQTLLLNISKWKNS